MTGAAKTARAARGRRRHDGQRKHGGQSRHGGGRTRGRVRARRARARRAARLRRHEGALGIPGGKLERGETAEDACRRELAEELKVRITDLQDIYTVEYDYPDFHLSMECFPLPHRGGRAPEERPPAPDPLGRAPLARHAHMDARRRRARPRPRRRREPRGPVRAREAPTRQPPTPCRATSGRTPSPSCSCASACARRGSPATACSGRRRPAAQTSPSRGARVAIFVNGCFWHRCPHCNPSMPRRNTEFWEAKFRRNVERDPARHHGARGHGMDAHHHLGMRASSATGIDETMARVIEQVRAAERPRRTGKA